MTTRYYPTVCGLWCDDCKHFEQECQGCNNLEGGVFWTDYVEIETCPVFRCVQDKGLAHCGFCDELPCERYTRFRDPDMSDEEIARRLDLQCQELRRRRHESEQITSE